MLLLLPSLALATTPEAVAEPDAASLAAEDVRIVVADGQPAPPPYELAEHSSPEQPVLYQDVYEILAPHTFHTHMKDGTCDQPRGGNYKGAALGEGEIHLHKVLECLRQVGYDGAWTAEYEGPEAEGGVGYEKCHSWLAENVA